MPRMANDDSESAATRDLERFLVSLGAKRLPHGFSQNLCQHLLNTRRILNGWAQPRWIQDAGALHSVYSTDLYQRHLLPLSKRWRLQAVAGKSAEQLAYLFCVLSRKHFFEELRSCTRLPGELHIRTHDDTEILTVSKKHVVGLIVLHMANEAEQAQGRSGEPGLWLSHVSWLGSFLHFELRTVPPVFDSCKAKIVLDEEKRLIRTYTKGMDSISFDGNIADREFSLSFSICPWIAEPAIWRAYIALQRGALKEARRFIRHAKVILDQWRTPWDKRLTFEEWGWFVSALSEWAVSNSRVEKLPWPDQDRMHEFVPALKMLDIKPHAVTSSVGRPNVETHSTPKDLHMEFDNSTVRFHEYVESFANSDPSRRMHVYPGLNGGPWHDPRRFSIVRELQNHFNDIRTEAMAIDHGAYHHETEPLHRKGDWAVFLLYEKGRMNAANCSRCPLTARLIESCDTVRSLAGLVYFSRMSPGAHIAAHCGPTNLRLRCHLAIEIPSGDCAIRVGDETRQWQQGQCLVFNDYLEHESWNHTATTRLVLVVDLWHPDLSAREIELINGLHRYAAFQAEDMNRYWAANAAARRSVTREQSRRALLKQFGLSR
jgi:aspartyl/asparaginyl beta-hydroxylase (cupin superfamily)